MSLDALVRWAGRVGCVHLALTDVNNLYGATQFYKLACERGVRAIIGTELSEDGVSVVALVNNETGYENLCELITRVHERTEQSAIVLADLAELSDGLELIVEDEQVGERLLAAGLLRERLWVGIDPGVQSYGELRRLIKGARKLDLPLVAMGKALVGTRGDGEAERLLAAIRTGTTFDAVSPAELPPPGAILRTSGQLSAQLGEFPTAITNNRRLTERCSTFKLLPRAWIFPDFPAPGGSPPRAYLRGLCEQGLLRRYASSGLLPAARVRLRKELSLIERMGFSEYFLVVWDIVQYARKHRAPVAGRGSGASCLVAYVLGITNVCPLTYDIPFERFLHERREDFPDLDVDFCWRIRDEVIDYVFRRWGTDHVAMVSTHNTFQYRSAVRETAKALGLSNEQISHLDRAEVSYGDDRRPRLVLRGIPEDLSRRIFELSKKILNLPHNLSVHPGGIVISRTPIHRTVPVQRAPKGVRITQYDKDGVEDIALVKLDLLGNRNLSTIRSAAALIERVRGERIDVESLPPADPQTIALLRSARTLGCNQLESPAMRNLLAMMRPSDTRDVMKVLALIRPGAGSLGMKETFIRRHRRLDPPPVPPPQVRGVLDDTYGVMLYEDDVMLTAAAMLGCSLSEADRFRKGIQKPLSDRERLALSREFLDRCSENAVAPDYAKSIWVQMAKFNAYSFCRAHAASYALLAYAGAYLKVHYPAEFWTAALNNNQSMYHPRLYVEHAKRDGVRFLLPDVNRSGEEFALEGEAMRVGLNYVAGLGPVSIANILRERTRGEFDSLSGFLSRTRLGQEEVRSLILCGAFDGFARSRPGLMMELNLFRRLGPARGGSAPVLIRAHPVIPDPPGDYSASRKYFDERRILGISVREHLMELYRPLLRTAGISNDSRSLDEQRNKNVRLAGLLEARRTTRTERGEAMMFLTLDDEYSLFEVTVFPDLYRSMNRGFPKYGPYLVTGKVEDQYGSLSVTGRRVEYFDVPLRELKNRSRELRDTA